MAAKKKPIYYVWVYTKFGQGLQPVKANNEEEARAKYAKRYPKSTIFNITKAGDGATDSFIKSHAI